MMSRQTSHIPDTDFSGRTHLILSDAYPPYAYGGAEISLSAVLGSLPNTRRASIVLLSFSNQITAMRTHKEEGVLIIHTPAVAPWPHSHMFEHALESSRWHRWLGSIWYSRLMRLGVLVSAADKSAVMAAYREARAHPAGGIMTDHLLGKHDLRVRLLKEICSRMDRVEHLLADNTRSIMLGGFLMRSGYQVTRSAAVVRDNRFHCARPTQNRRVGEAFCSVCEHACALEDAPTGVDLRKQTLSRTAEARSEALRQFDDVVVTSHELARHVNPVLSKDQRLVRIPNGFGKLEDIEENTIGVVQKPSQNILIIGMLNENKGQLEFLQACHSWLKRNPDIKVVLCGRGERIEEGIRKFAKKKNLGSQIRLLGFRSRSQIFSELRASTLVVAPTLWPEPFGRVPLEAGIARRAIVAFGVGGLNESIVDGKTGLLAPPGNYRALTDHIDYLLDNPEARVQMEEAAYNWITKEYGPEKTVSRFAETIYSKA